MLIALICLGFAGTVFALLTVLLGNRSDVSRRVAELEDTATIHTQHHTTPIVKHLLSGVDKTAIAAKLAEAGWYKTTVTHFVLSRLVCFRRHGWARRFLLTRDAPDVAHLFHRLRRSRGLWPNDAVVRVG
jgi:hypothetical protein